jgi:hypothetical protein
MAIEGGRNIGNGDLNDKDAAACSCNVATPHNPHEPSNDSNAAMLMEGVRAE